MEPAWCFRTVLCYTRVARATLSSESVLLGPFVLLVLALSVARAAVSSGGRVARVVVVRREQSRCTPSVARAASSVEGRVARATGGRCDGAHV